MHGLRISHQCSVPGEPHARPTPEIVQRLDTEVDVRHGVIVLPGRRIQTIALATAGVGPLSPAE